MCQFAAPPTPFLVGPLQAPNLWLLATGLVVFPAFLVARHYCRFLRPLAPGVRRKVALTLLSSGLLVLLAGMVLQLLVAVPTNDALGKWGSAQWDALQAHQCSESVINAFLATQLHAVLSAGNLVQLGFAVIDAGYVLLIAGYVWSVRHTSTQPARQ